jgi:hypothetical protein
MERNFERKSSIKKIVGGDEETRGRLMNRMDEVFSNQELINFKDFNCVEVKKNFDQMIAIDFVNEETNQLLESYGLPPFDLPRENVHVVDKIIDCNGDKHDGFNTPFRQAIVVTNTNSMLEFVMNVYHEAIHLKSYQALQLTPPNKVGAYRSGLKMLSRDDKKIYFKNFDEAVNIELCKIFHSRLKDEFMIMFREEFAKIEKIKAETIRMSERKNSQEVKESMDIKNVVNNSSATFHANLFPYQEERVALNDLINKLYQKNQEKFKDRREVFDLFAKAMLSGNVLELGKTIDRTFGAGTFRKIGELDAHIDKQKSFIRKLK